MSLEPLVVVESEEVLKKTHNDCAMSKKQRSTRRTPKGQTGNNLNSKIY